MSRRVRTPAEAPSAADRTYDRHLVVGAERLGQIVQIAGQKRYWARAAAPAVWHSKSFDDVVNAEQFLMNQFAERVADRAAKTARRDAADELRETKSAMRAAEKAYDDLLSADAEPVLANLDVVQIAEHLETRLAGSDAGCVDACIEASKTICAEHFASHIDPEDMRHACREIGIELVEDLENTDARFDAQDAACRIAWDWSHFKCADRIRPELDRLSTAVCFNGADLIRA